METIKPASQDPQNMAIEAALLSRTKNARKFILWASIATLLLIAILGIGVIGIYKQNQLALANKQHIDCIIKDLATPQKPGTSHKFISDLSTQCNIRFTP